MAQKQKPAASAEVTPEIIEGWKKQYGEVFVVESEGKKAWLRRPDRKAISAANVVGGSDALKINEVLIRNCWLGGDMEFQTEDRLFYGLGPQVNALIEVAAVELKKA